MLADTSKEVHSTIHPLIDRAREATSRLKKAIKSIPAEKSELKQTCQQFVDDNKPAIRQIVAATNSKINTMMKSDPKLSRLLYNHDEKTQEAFAEWMAEKSTETAPISHETASGLQSPAGKQPSEEAEDDEEDHRGKEEASVMQYATIAWNRGIFRHYVGLRSAIDRVAELAGIQTECCRYVVKDVFGKLQYLQDRDPFKLIITQ